MTLELSKILSRDSQLAGKIGSLKEQFAKLNEDSARLSVKKAGLSEAMGGEESTKKIIANKSQFPGVVGMVAELGDVDDKYALALEIAAGNKVKNIVVDTDQTASACIRYLKENRLGTATFIPINKIKVPFGCQVYINDILF